MDDADSLTPRQHERAAPARGYDVVASLAIVAVAVIALVASGFLPWWTMEARAPQYGQRVLVIDVNPRRVSGDVFEVDGLGHYVGIRPMETLAPVERTIAPLGLIAALLGLAAAPFLRRRLLRTVAVLPAVILPLAFMGDLKYWMDVSTNQRDDSAALNLTVTDIDAKLLGKYEIGQFKVHARAGGGLYIASFAGLLGLGLIFAHALPLPSILRRRRRAAVTTTAVALVIGVWPSASAAAAEQRLAPGQSLADAVAAAVEGDIIVVPAGVHAGHTVVDKRLTIVGEPGAVLDGEGRGTVLSIRAGGVELRGLTVQNSGDLYSAEDSGIRVQKAPGVHIVDTRVVDTLFGIFVAEGNDCVIERATVIGKDLPQVRRGDGIRLWYSSGCLLRDNLVERSRDVIVWYSARTRAEGNVVRNSRYGLHYMYSDNNVFWRNRFEDNQVGAAIMYSRGVELRENTFSFSNGVAAYGLLVKDADDVFVEQNRFVANEVALFFDGAPQSRGKRVTIKGNLIARNEVGIALQPLTRGIEISDNSFIGNDVQVRVLGTGTAGGNQWAVEGRGNFWSDAVTYDRDGDGISDLPHAGESSFESLSAMSPVLSFFEGTPAAAAIDAATRLFPIFGVQPTFTDPHPLVRPTTSAWAPVDPGTSGVSGMAMAITGTGMLAVAIAGALVARGTLA